MRNSPQIGWSQEAKLLYEIIKKLDTLIKVMSTTTSTTLPPG